MPGQSTGNDAVALGNAGLPSRRRNMRSANPPDTDLAVGPFCQSVGTRFPAL